MALVNRQNDWVESYIDALLSAGLSTEAARRAAEQQGCGSPDDDPDASIAAKYYVQQLLRMDEESIQQTWLKARAASNARLSGERDARLEHIAWRVWTMRRKAAEAATAAAALGPARLSSSSSSCSFSVAGDSSSVPSTPKFGGAASDGAAAAGEAEAEPEGACPPAAAAGAHGPRLRRLAIPPRDRAAASELLLLSESSDEPPSATSAAAAAAAALATPTAAGAAAASPRAGAAAAALARELAGLNLGEGRVPKLYVVLISMHGLVRGDRMELGRDPDTGGQVKYVVELARALARHPAVHRVDLLTRLIRDPAVAPDYGATEEALTDGAAEGALGGARIVRLAAGPTDKYLRKEALWPYVREFADNALSHVTATLGRLAEAGEVCELYAVHGHYADAGEAAALVSATLGVDMALTGHSLGRNKLDHLIKSRTMTRAEIEATYAISRRIEGEERALDAASIVFTSTQQEVKEQWGLYDGYDPSLARILAARPRNGRAFPAVSVIPPGLDFSALKVDPPPDPWQQLAEAAAPPTPVAGAAGAGAAGGHRLRRESSGAVAGGVRVSESDDTAVADQATAAAVKPPPSPTKGGGPTPVAAAGPKGPAAPVQLQLPAPINPADAPAAAAAGGGLMTSASPRTPPTPLVAAGVGSGGAPSSPVVGAAGGAAHAAFRDPPIWQEIFRFLRNPRKPVILAMSRPDAKKNITALVRAFGESRPLREIANLVLVMGNRAVIDGMAAGSARVLTEVLKLVDAYDLYGSVAYPKRHSQDDISDIYLLPHHTRGAFVNVALQEPFGLTLIEAAAHGVPIVATTHGGPVDIVATLQNGLLVDPTDPAAIGEALLGLLTDGNAWERYAAAGRGNINAYSWPSHCVRYLVAIEREKLKARSRAKAAMRSTFSGDLGDIADQLTAGGPGAGTAAATDGDPQAAAPDTAAAAAPTTSADGPSLATVSVPLAGAGGAGASPKGAAGADGGFGLPVSPPPASPRAARLSFDGGSFTLPSADGGGGGAGGGATAASLMGGTGAAATAVALQPPRPNMLPAASAAAAPQGGGRFAILLLDSTAAAARLGALATRGARGRLSALLASTANGGGRQQFVRVGGVGVASVFPLPETLRLLSAAGVRPGDLNFAITLCGSQVWYRSGRGRANDPSAAAALDPAAFASDDAFEALIDARWDKAAAQRILTHLLAQRGALSGLAGCRPAAGGAPQLKVEVDADTGPHHLLLTLRRSDGGGTAGGAAAPPPPLSARELSALVARIKRRLRASGVRAQVTAALDAAGGGEGCAAATLHVTPLRASRALALRFVAHRHRVGLSDITLLAAAAPAAAAPADAAGGGDAASAATAAPMPHAFAASDADDLLGGTQRVVVVVGGGGDSPAAAGHQPPGPGSSVVEITAGSGVAGAADGFVVDLAHYTHDSRVCAVPHAVAGP